MVDAMEVECGKVSLYKFNRLGIDGDDGVQLGM